MIIKYDFITTLFIVETRHFMSNVCYFGNGMYCKGVHLANIIQFCNILKNPEKSVVLSILIFQENKPCKNAYLTNVISIKPPNSNILRLISKYTRQYIHRMLNGIRN